MMDRPLGGLLTIKLLVDGFVPSAPAVKRIVENAAAVSHITRDVSVLEPKTSGVARGGCTGAPAHSGYGTVSFGPFFMEGGLMLTLHEDGSGMVGVGTGWLRIALPRVPARKTIARIIRMDLIISLVITAEA
jgi:hypothetical protein